MAGKFKFAPAYVANKKVAELQTVDFEIMSGAESMIGTEGYVGHTDGAFTCKATFDCIVPVKGTTPGMIDKLLNGDDVSIGLPVDGSLFKFTGRLTGITYNSESKSGKTTGKYTFEGGKPDKT